LNRWRICVIRVIDKNPWCRQ